MEEELTAAEKEQMKELMGYSTSGAEGKHNIHSFLNNVAIAEDTTKTGFLTDIEIGKLDNPIRSYKFLALFADKMMGKDGLKQFFLQQSEIGTATSLSRDAILLKLAVTQKRELADVTTKPKKENSSWFKSKKDKNAPDVGGGSGEA